MVIILLTIQQQVFLFYKLFLLGHKKKEGYFRDQNLFGYGKFYNEDGRLGFEGNFFNNKKCGEGMEYYSNGQLKSKGGYKNDLYHGKLM